MTSVKNAETNTIRSVMVIMNGVGTPVSSDPVLVASQKKAILTGYSMKSTQPMAVRRTQRALNPDEALTSATVSANKIQPTTSFPTPAARTTTPTVVSNNLSSVRIRQRTV